MIFSINSKPSLGEFEALMERTDNFLNDDAKKRPGYYAVRAGNPVEDDVLDALKECARGTVFENTIEKISGQKFPDIVAAKYYGVEVKSTKYNHWTSTGSSILESSRLPDVERIFITFGKLGGKPPEFCSRPYEQCLSGIAVTHMPRYRIDMRLKEGETIFDKMGVSYDELKAMDNPVGPVSKYYRSLLKPGESLWWASDSGDEAVSAKIRLWKNVPAEEKSRFIVYGCINFPEVFAGDYDRYALWLTSQGVVDSHIRDQFSAGGQEEMLLNDGSKVRLPAVYRRIKDNAGEFIRQMSQEDTSDFKEEASVGAAPLDERLNNWSEQVSRYSRADYGTSMNALLTFFKGINAMGNGREDAIAEPKKE